LAANQGRRHALLATALAMLAIPTVAVAQTGLPTVDPTVPAERDTEPVILAGQNFGAWSVPSNQTANAPAKDLTTCLEIEREDCEHNHYEQPEVDTAGGQPSGTPTDRLLGYRWNEDTDSFEQIRFQVDEVFTRYLNNDASNFAIYSGSDQHTTYAYDREGFRFTANEDSDPCHAVPALDPSSNDPQPGGEPTTPDPIAGLDDNDELVFMASDAGPLAPPDAALPDGIQSAQIVTITDPLTGAQSYAYVMKAAAGGPAPAFDADSGYVDYQRDPGADTFEYSESDFSGYGNAPKGPYCDRDGNRSFAHGDEAERRPRDFATISTPRYQFRYDGRWLMTGIRVSQNDDGNYGRDLIDRWKARAFAQDPSSETPCCGFEEEDTNWGGSSQLLGERVGPVRAIRETWGADSGTNVIRRETFYRDEMRQKTWLRVHVIPPLDGIYAQWDFNAGVMTRYFNPKVQGGVPVDGKNDELLGNLDDPCNPKYDAENNPNNTSAIDQQYRTAYQQFQLCNFPYHLSIDVTDPTFGAANASLDWNETTGPEGTIIDRISIDKVTDLTPGGAAQSVAALPYYRDDSCFDDGTGSDPGERINPGASSDEQTFEGAPRKCWDSDSDSPIPAGDRRYFQGDIGAHGLHLLFQAESDNARLQVPITEIVSQWRMVMLPGQRDAAAGEAYGRGFEKPLVAAVAPVALGNSRPTAEFSFDPAAPSSGDPVSFDASASSDSDAVSVGENEVATGGISRYEWDLDGDGVFETDGAASPQLSHAFARPGTYEVGLRVTDNRGATGTASQTVTVANRGPTAAITFSPDSPTTDDTITFDGSGSSDPDGTISGYEWDLDGDGEFETDTRAASATTHRFDDPGTYEVSLRVTDESGASDEATTEVEVSSPPPAPQGNPGPGSQGSAGATARAAGFRLELRRSGRALLSYTARLPVEGVLDLKLVGVRDGSKRPLARQQLTAERAGDVALSGGLKRVARRCRPYDACRLVAHATVTSVATLLYDETKRIRLK
jgi:PKD repeat protein